MNVAATDPWVIAVRNLDRAIGAMTRAVYEGTEDERKIALDVLLDARKTLGVEAGKLADS